MEGRKDQPLSREVTCCRWAPSTPQVPPVPCHQVSSHPRVHPAPTCHPPVRLCIPHPPSRFRAAQTEEKVSIGPLAPALFCTYPLPDPTRAVHGSQGSGWGSERRPWGPSGSWQGNRGNTGCQGLAGRPRVSMVQRTNVAWEGLQQGPEGASHPGTRGTARLHWKGPAAPRPG